MERVFFKFSVVSSGSWIAFGGNAHFMQNNFAGILRNLGKGDGRSIIISGLGLSRVLVPRGPWPLERGRGGSAWLRSKRGGGYVWLLRHLFHF